MPRGHAPHPLEHLAHQLPQLEALAPQLQPAELQPRDLEQFLHQLAEAVALAVEDLEGLALPRLVPSRRPALQELVTIGVALANCCSRTFAT